MGIIRTLLALAVVLYHSYGIGSAGNFMTGGTVSVQAFYMISGFYMALIINEKYADKKNSYRLFITNRFLRIYPVYWVTLIFVILVCVAGQLFFGEPFYLWYWESHWSMLTWSTIIALVLANIFLIGSDWLMFTGINPHGSLEWTQNPYGYSPMTGQYLFIPQIWTVGVELSFYIIAPFVVRAKWFLQVALICACIYLFRYLYFTCGYTHDPWTYRFFPTQLGLFMAGSVAYQVYRFIHRFVIPKLFSVVIWLTIVLLIVFYPDWSTMNIFAKTTPDGTIYENVSICFFCALFLALPFIFSLFRNTKWDRFIGELSFPVYVCHHAVMFLWRKFFWAHAHYMSWFGITTAVSSLVMAAGLYFIVVKPLEKFRQSRVQQKAQMV